ncbi:MAG: DUF5106 domain-containing protein [Flavobacteriales bacterium]|nr:DUF5106 domain-containing protein [Flavobacteriales bacterium]
MKTLKLILIFLIGFGFSAKAQYNLVFKVDGLHPGDSCILAHYYADQNKIVDTAAVQKDGKLHFKGSGPLLHGVYILVFPKRNYIEFIVPKDDQQFEIACDTASTPQSKKAIGSLENEVFFGFDKFAIEPGLRKKELIEKYKKCTSEACKDSLRPMLRAIDMEVHNEKKRIIDQYPNTFVAKLYKALMEIEIPEELGDDEWKRYEYYREHYWDNFDLTDDGMMRTPIYNGKLEYYFTKIFAQSPDSLIPYIDNYCEILEKNNCKETYKYAIWWLVSHYEKQEVICLDGVVYHMAQKYYCAGKSYWADSSTTKRMCEYVQKNALIQCGKVAPNMTLPDTSLSRMYSLHRLQYPVTVVVFWQPNCGHCKKEVPILKEMYDTLHTKGVEIFAVMTQNELDDWRAFIRNNKLEWINVLGAVEGATFREDYNQKKTPEIYILDEKKRIIFKNPPAENVGHLVQGLLDEYYKNHKP